MLIDKLPPLGVIKHLRGLIDVYVLHVGGVDRVVARAWPQKGSGYRTESFRRTKNAATITLQAYNSLDDKVRILANSFHRYLNDTFLDHFRAGYQHYAFELQGFAPYFTKIEARPGAFPDEIEFRFFRPFACTIFVNHRQPQRTTYRQLNLNRSRGVVCEKYYYLRPVERYLNSTSDNLGSWTGWFPAPLNCELEVFCDQPRADNPVIPWFGPYKVDILYDRYLRLS